jgi:uncharacterized RDD family membrane protein YckC
MNKTPLWKHFAAFLYDIFPLLGIFILTSLIVAIIRKGNIVGQHTLWFDILIFSELMFYFVYSWKIGGQTLGMRAWKIKITPRNELTDLSWTQALLRFITGIASTLLCGLGLFWKLASKNNQSWMDLASNSKTINVDK